MCVSTLQVCLIRLLLRRSERSENAKIQFRICVEEICLNRSGPRLPSSKIYEFKFLSQKDVENSIFRFRANRGPFVVESNLCFFAVSKKSIFMVRNPIFGGHEETRKSRILNSNSVL